MEVKTHKEEIIIECKDMDDITTKWEICNAFEEEFEISNLKEDNIKSIRKAYGGTQTAKISVPVDVASKVLGIGKIKIGWSVCRIREITKPVMCFRCLEYGHIAKSCKSECDRSHKCRKCGLEGHVSRECTAEPNCMLCRAIGESDVKHNAGSYRCPVFKKALNARRK